MSSHGVILPSLLGWHANQGASTFLPFFVVLHLGTATALLAFFRQEWAGVAAYASTVALKFLFRKREIGALDPFGYYCVAAGIFALVFLLVS